MTTEADTASQPAADIDLDALIRELDEGWHELPEEALRTCQQHRELVIPRLIEVLEEAVRLGREGTIREGEAPFYALFLLTEFAAKQSLPVILDAISLPERVLEGLFGDAVTDTMPRVLAVLAGDQPDVIESLINSRQLYDYIRWEAAAALCQLVRDGRLSRSDAQERLVRQMRAAISVRDIWGTTITVNELGELNPLEVQHEIKAAFDQDLVDESVTDWHYFDEYLLLPDEPEACPAIDNWEPSAITDTVAELRGWHCFSEKRRRERERWKSRAADDEDYDDDGIDDVDPFYAQQFQQITRSLEAGDPELTDDRPLLALPSTVRHEMPKVGRNDPCPCGSGKKYKKCCLRGENRV